MRTKSHLKHTIKHPLEKNLKITPNHIKRHQTTPKANLVRPNLTSVISHQIIQKQITPKSHQKTLITTKKYTNHTKPHQKTQNHTKGKNNTEPT